MGREGGLELIGSWGGLVEDGVVVGGRVGVLVVVGCGIVVVIILALETLESSSLGEAVHKGAAHASSGGAAVKVGIRVRIGMRSGTDELYGSVRTA